jgi:hypothetical protein
VPVAVTFFTVALAIHIAAVVVGLGVTFVYPLVFTVALRARPNDAAAIHRAQGLIGRFIITPLLVVVLGFGLYLAHHLSAFSKFYVDWGIAIVVVLGGLGGAFFAPREGRLAELADRDTAAGAPPSGEYLALRGQVLAVNIAANVLILATIYFMTAQTGA